MAILAVPFFSVRKKFPVDKSESLWYFVFTDDMSSIDMSNENMSPVDTDHIILPAF